MSDIEREAFETWYENEFKRKPSEAGYETFITWSAWQAARQATASGEVEPVEGDGVGSLPWFIEVYNHGYQAGHNDTVEGYFTDIHYSDLQTYHEDEVMELLEGLNVNASHAHPPAKVPEGLESLVREAEEACQDDGNQTMRESALAQKWLNSLNAAITLLTTPTPATTPQSEGDGWAKPDAYAVIEHDGRIGYTVMVDIEGVHENRQEEAARQFCHDHINEACSGGIEGAGSWVVRPLIIAGLKRPQPPVEQEGE